MLIIESLICLALRCIKNLLEYWYSYNTIKLILIKRKFDNSSIYSNL